MSFKAGNNQNFILFRVAGKDCKWRISQVHNLLDNLGLVATPYMENPIVIGFSQHDMDNHEIVKLIKQAHSSGEASRVHWAATETSSRVFRKLAANLSVPIMASQGSHRERKAPERLKMTEEPKKPRRKGPLAEEIQAKRQRLQAVERHYESEEEVDVSPPSTQEFGVFDNFIREATADAQSAEAPPAVEPKETASESPAVDPVQSSVASDCKQVSGRKNFGFNSPSTGIWPQEADWKSQGVVEYEEVKDKAGTRYVLLTFAKRLTVCSVTKRLAYLGVKYVDIETYGYGVYNARHNSSIVKAMRNPDNEHSYWFVEKNSDEKDVEACEPMEDVQDHGIEARAISEDAKKTHEQAYAETKSGDKEENDDDWFQRIVDGDAGSKAVTNITQFVREHLKHAPGKKLFPDHIYDRYDEVCGVLCRTMVRRYLNRVVTAEIPGVIYGTSVFGGKKTGYENIEFVQRAAVEASSASAEEAPDVPVVQATFLGVVDPPMVSPSLVFAQPNDPPVDPPAEQAEQPVVEAVYMPNFSAVYEKVDTSTEIKRLEAHLADRDAEIKRVVDAKDKHLADKDIEIKRLEEAKDAEIKRLEEVFRLHLAEKDAALAARAKQIEILKGAVI